MLNALDNLPEDPVELRRVTELLASEVKARALMIGKLQHQLHGANRHRFGSKSEGMDQLQLFAGNEEIAEAAVKAADTAPAEPIELKEKPGRKPLPDHLERIGQVLSVGEDCPGCGGDLSKPGEDITEEPEYIPGRFVVNKITRPRMACRRCEAISQAPVPSRKERWSRRMTCLRWKYKLFNYGRDNKFRECGEVDAVTDAWGEVIEAREHDTHRLPQYQKRCHRLWAT